MSIRPITREEAKVRVLAEPDDIPVEGNALLSGDDNFDREVERNIMYRLQQADIWAWAAVTVVVAWGSFESRAYLGCCSYADEEDFTQLGGYFDDMVAEALDELNRTISETYQEIKNWEMAA